ncbi:Aldo-keto reductase family 1 member [Wickerhamomyces ciferrii]|uniref:Aldo-keto reductase family 1 member n=1 Tax=Wickerhamomyces ciferrii (strain ATCC 14091 / BCRC 22168 / CBS 111 / JCM 3599 / NBRC 0793 / NRRL Y-1031 F-60-10) TaxID=1206466 RepID=K0KC20_WICCF|nr:Aldo-keto reductase family 1 member [Wickerhamomyces ciferrii]CCH42620.1 Aldo-keto reductase family 1 member [Wickerhamomyces ciferrii]
MSTYRTLKSGYKMPSLALGMYHIEPQQCTSIVKDALKIGYRGFDSAQFYKNEKRTFEAISQWIEEDPQKNKRDDLFFTTKLFDGVQGYDMAKKSISRTLDKAKQVGSYIDQALILSPQTNKEKRLETYRALQDLVKDGVVHSIGVANYGIPHIQELYDWDGLEIEPDVNQVELHPWLMRKELVDYCNNKEIQLVAYSPLAKGKKFNMDEKLTKLAKKYDKTQGQILIRWSIQQGFIPLPKTSNQERLLSNFDVFDWEINEADAEILDHPELYYVTGWDPTTYEDQ